jgi:alpha-ketoglutarate-dependent 2,4-dichlorophenoxyacetate dioxygenase
MTISVTALHPLFGAAVSGLDLRLPVDMESLQSILPALYRYAVLVFRNQPINDDQQVALSGLFGTLETPPVASLRVERPRLNNRYVADVSNLDADNRIRSEQDPWRQFQKANQLWHTDGSFKRVPASISFLSARELPLRGGETEFADLRAAYDELELRTRVAIEGLEAVHSIAYSRGLVGYEGLTQRECTALPPVAHPLVRVAPGSGRKSLYLGSHASHIAGVQVNEGRTLLKNLTAFATQPRFVYRHCWQLFDLVVWDNRCTLHRGQPYDDLCHRRDMRRTTVVNVDAEQKSVSLGGSGDQRTPVP